MASTTNIRYPASEYRTRLTASSTVEITPAQLELNVPCDFPTNLNLKNIRNGISGTTDILINYDSTHKRPIFVRNMDRIQIELDVSATMSIQKNAPVYFSSADFTIYIMDNVYEDVRFDRSFFITPSVSSHTSLKLYHKWAPVNGEVAKNDWIEADWTPTVRCDTSIPDAITRIYLNATIDFIWTK